MVPVSSFAERWHCALQSDYSRSHPSQRCEEIPHVVSHESVPDIRYLINLVGMERQGSVAFVCGFQNPRGEQLPMRLLATLAFLCGLPVSLTGFPST